MIYKCKMEIKEKIKNNYPLINRIDFDLECYLLDKRRYLIFWDKLIVKSEIINDLNYLSSKIKNNSFPEWKTFIIVGKTKDKFKKDELFFFDNVSTFVVFYLFNEETNEIYFNDYWIYALGCSYRKYIRKINAIINSDK